jgi:hypothetical protein
MTSSMKLLGGIVIVALLGGVGWFAKPPIGYNNDYAPDQPIPYSHALHAGKYQIPCQYCHSNVEKSKHATVPSLNVCMNCHLVIKGVGPNGGPSPWIERISQAYDAGESVPWVKVHMLPDHAHFNHKRHVGAGVSCQECHGKMQETVVVKQVQDLSMGWCINCHRKPENNAPINCSTCHY